MVAQPFRSLDELWRLYLENNTPGSSSGSLTDAQLRNTAVLVTTSNPTANPETGLAKDATVGRRFAPSTTRLTRAQTIAVATSTVLVATTAAQKVRLYWIGLSSSQNNLTENSVQVKIGTTVIYDWYMGNPGAFAHFEIVDGTLDDDLIIVTSTADAIKVNFTYEVI